MEGGRDREREGRVGLEGCGTVRVRFCVRGCVGGHKSLDKLQVVTTTCTCTSNPVWDGQSGSPLLLLALEQTESTLESESFQSTLME